MAYLQMKGYQCARVVNVCWSVKRLLCLQKMMFNYFCVFLTWQACCSDECKGRWFISLAGMVSLNSWAIACRHMQQQEWQNPSSWVWMATMTSMSAHTSNLQSQSFPSLPARYAPLNHDSLRCTCFYQAHQICTAGNMSNLVPTVVTSHMLAWCKLSDAMEQALAAPITLCQGAQPFLSQ